MNKCTLVGTSSNWTKLEIEKLTRMYPYLTNEHLSKIFNRNISSIQHKATRLKLTKDKEFNFIIRSECKSGSKASNWKDDVNLHHMDMYKY